MVKQSSKWRKQARWLWLLPFMMVVLMFGLLHLKQTTSANRALQKIATGHSINAVAISPDGQYLVMGRDMYPAVVSIWNLAARQFTQNIDTGHDHGIGFVAIAPDNKTLVTGSIEDDIRLLFWDVATGKALNELKTSHRFIKSLAYSRDGNVLVSAGDNRSRESIVLVWDLRSKRLLYTLVGTTGDFAFAYPMPDNKTLLVLTGERCTLHDLKSGKVLRTVSKTKQREVLKAALAPDGNLLAVGSRSRDGGAEFIELWEIETGKRRFHVWENQGAVLESALKSLAFTPDGKMLVSSTADLGSSDLDRSRTSVDRGIRFHDVETGKVVHTLQPTPYSKSITFSLDGKTLAASVEKEVYLWDTESLNLD